MLDIKGAATKKKHLLGLCKTRWVERHTCFETLLELYEYVCICLHSISSPHHHPELRLVTPSDPTSEDWGWQSDTDVKISVQGLYSNLQNPEFIMAFIVVKNSLSLLRGITVKLQKRDNDTLLAYSMIAATRKKVEDLRSNIDENHKLWFKEAEKIAELVGTVMIMPRIAGRQTHRANAAGSRSLDYYRVNYTVKFLAV